MKNINESLIKLRVHIAAVGFEIDRIVLPLINLKADKVWLIVEPDIKSSKAIHHFNEIKKRLVVEKIHFDIKQCDIRDLFDLLKHYRDIITQELGNQILINVSTGTKIEAIAGTMASMIFKDEDTEILPYYVCPEKYEITPEQGEQFTSGYKGVIELPNYRIDKPNPRLIKTLRIVSEMGPVKKIDLIERCVKENLIVVNKNSNHQDSAKHSQLTKNLIEPMLHWKLIEIKEKGKRGRIEITQDGKNILKFLR